MSVRLRGIIAAAGVAVAAAVLALRVCDLMFACGCSWPWSGAAMHCNAFIAKAKMHCPWCVHPLLGWGLFSLAAVVGGGVAVRGDARGRLNPGEKPAAPRSVLGRPLHPPLQPRPPATDLVVRLLAGVGVFVALTLAAGLATALATGYPRFLPPWILGTY